MNKIEKLKNGVIISCYTNPKDPFFSSYITGRLAISSKNAGALGVLVNGVNDAIQVKNDTDIVIIAMIRKKYKQSEVMITPSINEVKKLINCPCDIIAIDMTNRGRPYNDNVKEMITLIHQSDKEVLGCISNLSEALEAQGNGCDAICTSIELLEDNFLEFGKQDKKLIKECTKKVDIPVIAGLNIISEKQMKKIKKYKPYAYVLGTSVSCPSYIAKKYVDLL